MAKRIETVPSVPVIPLADAGTPKMGDNAAKFTTKAEVDAAIGELFASSDTTQTKITQAVVIAAQAMIDKVYAQDAKAVAKDVYAMRGVDAASVTQQQSKFARGLHVALLWNGAGLDVVKAAALQTGYAYNPFLTLMAGVKKDYAKAAAPPDAEKLTALATPKKEPKPVIPEAEVRANDMAKLIEMLAEFRKHPGFETDQRLARIALQLEEFSDGLGLTTAQRELIGNKEARRAALMATLNGETKQ